MSEFFAETNNEPLAGLFNKRAYYKLLNSDDLTNFGAEKYLYGRVDREFKPVYAYSGYSFNFKSIERKARNNEDHRALNFVVDAFNDLAQQFAKCLQIGQIDGDHPYLSNLRVYRSYQDPRKAYNNYINSYTNIFASKNRDVEKFEDIQPRIDAALKVSSKSSPFTFPAFVKNRRTPITITGLAIEIADVNAANDNAKMDLFLNSLNWQFYLTAARSFGFMVDLDVPWRLVADIGSSVMLSYAARYGASTTDEVLNQYFNDASYQYLLEYPERMYQMYNNTKPTQIQFTQECTNGKTYLRTRRPRDYGTLENFRNDFDSDYFLRNYCTTRIAEEEIQLSENEINILIDDTIEMSKANFIGPAINAFERVINKTFDNLGSLSYNVNKRKLDSDNNLTSINTLGF
jgi:hypothetical protein